MPKVKTTSPALTKQKYQRSTDISDLPLFLTRNVPIWGTPAWLDGKLWREIVKRQPLAILCRETLIGNILALDWKIEPRDSTQRDDLKEEIKYYTKLFEDTGDYDFTQMVEWLVTDLLDIPFGGIAEVGREGDDPKGKILWIELLDGATCFPWANPDWPVGQTVTEVNRTVFFPSYSVDRIYMSPRTEIRRKGWGMPPPEKIYLALELLNRGDIYYANLLLDSPETGILDLGDMAEESAKKWVESWRTMLSGIDPFKIPVLYEHERDAKFIPFVRSPTELMFDKAVSRYGGIVAAGYGMSMSDIGFSATSSGGETLAGSIRGERSTRKNGLARVKNKLVLFFNRLLPETLKFTLIDLDDELSVALGRARLANATAWGQMIDKGMFTAEEGRQQTIADGLITISVPEKVPESEIAKLKAPPNQTENPARPGMLGNPVPPSKGGQGEVVPLNKPLTRSGLMDEFINISKSGGSKVLRLAYDVYMPLLTEFSVALNEFGEDGLEDWSVWHDQLLTENLADTTEVPEVTREVLKIVLDRVRSSMDNEDWWKIKSDEAKSDILTILSTVQHNSQILRYIKGDLKQEPDQIDPNEFLSQLELVLACFEALFPDVLAQELVRPVRSYLVENKRAVPFEDMIEDVDFIVSIQNVLSKSCNTMLEYILDKISSIINNSTDKILENDNATSIEINSR